MGKVNDHDSDRAPDDVDGVEDGPDSDRAPDDVDGADNGGQDSDTDAGAAPQTPVNGPHGFPVNTPIKDMTAEQEAAYHKYHKRKAENRVRELERQVNGSQDAGEQAIEDARNAGRAEGLAVAAESELARLTGRSKEDLAVLTAVLPQTAFVKDGALDLDAIQKVANLVTAQNPSQKRGSLDDFNNPGSAPPKNNKVDSVSAAKDVEAQRLAKILKEK